MTELWCQGYSEPGAGSDLANVSTTAELDGDQWVINGQKVWTSLAHLSQWCFVVARTEKGSKRHAGLSYLLVPLDQPGVAGPADRPADRRPRNSTRCSSTTPAPTPTWWSAQPGDGWRVAMGTLTFERGVSTLGQQIRYARELSNLAELAKRTGAADDPLIRERLTRVVGRAAGHALATRWRPWTSSSPARTTCRSCCGPTGIAIWASWPWTSSARPAWSLTDGEFDEWQRLYLFTRADTIYGGSNEIQRNIIAERVLGLPEKVMSLARRRRC